MRPVEITVSPVAVVDPVSVGVMMLTFGNAGVKGLILLIDGDSSWRVSFVPPKLLCRCFRARWRVVESSASNIGVVSPLVRARILPLSSCGDDGRPG